MAPQKINIKERLTDNEIDLSMSDLQDVPVKEIVHFKKATSLDISNNHLTVLPKNFTILTHLVKLDLSRNQLSELPKDFGELSRLRYLDLFKNNLQYLPLDFCKLKALKWLDLKDNPLVPALAKVAGLCHDTKECQTCAKDVVNFFSQLQSKVDSEVEVRNRQRQRQLEANQQKQREDKENKETENVKEKQENEEIPVAPTNEKSIKSTNKTNVVKDQPKKNWSLLKICLNLLVSVVCVLFFLTSIRFEYTTTVESHVKELYYHGLDFMPDGYKDYGFKLGQFIGSIHENTGNTTNLVFKLVKNNENFINVYNTFNALINSISFYLKNVYSSIVLD